MKKLLLFGALALSINSFAQVPSYVPANGLLAWYPFNGNTLDESFNGNNGTINGGVTLSDDRFANANSAYLFDGQELTYINCGNDPMLAISNGGNLTVCAWINASGNSFTPGRQMILSKNGTTALNLAGSYSLWLQDGFPQFTISNQGGQPNWYQTASGTNALNTGTWYLLSGVLDAAAGEVRVYVNGEHVGTDTWAGTIDSDVSTDLLIGCHYKANFSQGYTYNFGGDIDDVALWNRVLDACELQDLYHAQLNSLTGISQNGSQLTADISGGTYQWLDCDNSYAEIMGETNQFFNVSVNGNYAVEVTSNGCTDTTSCVIVDFTGIDELNQENKELIKIVDLMGREVPYEKNKVLIYVYSDGTTERVFEFE